MTDSFAASRERLDVMVGRLEDEAAPCPGHAAILHPDVLGHPDPALARRVA